MQKEIELNLNYKKFILLSSLCNLVLIGCFIRSQVEFWVFLFNYWIIIGYQVFLVKGGLGIVNAALGAKRSGVDKTRIVIMFIGKIFLIFGALSLSVHFIGNKILVPLLNYVFHLFILAFALWHPRVR